MENRRQSFRLAFDPEESLRIELSRPGQRGALAGQLADLSLGGSRVRLRDGGDSLRIGDTVVFRVLGRDTPMPASLTLAVPSKIVYLRQHGEEWHCGIQFLPLANPRANEEIERNISTFLLAEQRLRRQKRDEKG